MKSALQDVTEQIDEQLAKFESDGEDLNAIHEFIANFIGSDEVLGPAHEQLIVEGLIGDPPDGGGWLYMHVWRPLTRSAVIELAEQLDAVAHETRCLFELLDVTLQSGSRRGHCIILGVCNGEAIQNA